MGGWYFTLLVLILFGTAAWEFSKIFHQGGYNPSTELLVGGVIAVILAQHLIKHQDYLLLSLAALGAMMVAIVQYERGTQHTALNFCITLGGIFYLGITGSYFIALRNLPEGMWWVLIILPAVWLADAGAYMVGRRFGRHKLSKRVSPKKSWEGYFAGIITGSLATALLAALWGLRSEMISAQHGLVLGLAISIISPIGDLAESMLKREFGLKDSSNLLPGHGGFLDRIDSWIVAVPVGYYIIIWFWS